MKKVMAIAALAALPMAANAELLASVEGFGSFTTFESGGMEEDSDGFGLRGRINLPGTGFFARAEYLDEETDSGFDYTETHIGGGMSADLTPILEFTGELRYIDGDFGGVDIDGYGAYVGLEAGLPLVSLYGRGGLGWLESDVGNVDVDATDITLGARIGIGIIGIFAEYRMLTLEPDGGPDLDIDGYRLGARVAF